MALLMSQREHFLWDVHLVATGKTEGNQLSRRAIGEERLTTVYDAIRSECEVTGNRQIMVADACVPGW